MEFIIINIVRKYMPSDTWRVIYSDVELDVLGPKIDDGSRSLPLVMVGTPGSWLIADGAAAVSYLILDAALSRRDAAAVDDNLEARATFVCVKRISRSKKPLHVFKRARSASQDFRSA